MQQLSAITMARITISARKAAGNTLMKTLRNSGKTKDVQLM